MFVSVLDLPELISEILRSRKILGLDGAFLFRLKGCPSWYNDSLCISVKGNKASVMERLIEAPDIVVEADMPTLVSCIFGTANVSRAIISSKIRVRPFWKIRMILKLFSLLQIRSPWFIPRADYG